MSSCTERRQLTLLRSAEEKLSTGQYQEAAELLKKILVLNPESRPAVKALYKLGFVDETYLKDFDAALFSYQEFIRLSQDNMSIYEVQKRVANIYFEFKQDHEKSIEAYKKLISFNPSSVEVDLFQFRIGQSYFYLNNFEQARLEYQQLLEHFPKSQFASKARFETGNSYYMEGKYDIAQEALKQVLRHHGQTEHAIEAQFLIAQCLELQDKLLAAIQTYESIRGRYPSKKILELRISQLTKRLKEKR
ncbi:MAG: tetratricopeptide repeat protein [Deltaproteobacteria bacterium]|nr:tetratricopeptide repeat protein [Deltaproteobacteria bacterium]